GEGRLRVGLGEDDLDRPQGGEGGGLGGEGAGRGAQGARARQHAVDVDDDPPGRARGARSQGGHLQQAAGRAVLRDLEISRRQGARLHLLGEGDVGGELDGGGGRRGRRG